MTGTEVDTERTEHVVAVATQLFAELGYDGTSLGLIGDATGVDVATIKTAVGGGKAELYRAVMMRAHEAEREALADVTRSFTPTRAGMAAILDAYLDFYADDPRMVSLWLHRRMGDATDISELEELYLRPPFTKLADALRDSVPPDLDIDYVLWTIPWLVSGFLSAGVMHSVPRDHTHGSGMQLTPDDLRDFRGYLHQLIERILPLPSSEESTSRNTEETGSWT